MKQHLAIYNTNQINKYGYKFPTDVLEKALKQTWKLGTPMFISHDYHRPLGWSKPLGLHLASHQVCLYGVSSFPETDIETDKINDMARTYIINLECSIEADLKDKLVNELGIHFSGNQFFMRRECVCVVDDNIVNKALSTDLVGNEKDKRSLVSLNKLKIIAPGVYEINQYIVFAHRYFRRSLSQFNNLNDIFLTKLQSLVGDNNLDIKIALDPHSIGLKDTYLTPIELDYWWGPKFNDSLLEIPKGVTCHQANDRQRFYHGILRTEFWWHKQNNIQSLECEEVRDLPTLGVGSDKYGCRYVHSMISKESQLPYHLDGAVRLYDEDGFIERLDTDIAKAGKNTEYIKLWRVDGEIKASLWKELICDFYRDNQQVGEYLLGEEDNKNNNHTTKEKKDIVNSYVPDYMKKDHGVHIFVSYNSLDKYKKNSEINLISTDTLGNTDISINTVEFDSLDLIKMINSEIKRPIIIDSNIKLVAYEDPDINYPLIIHSGNSAVSLANKTINHLYTLCREFSKHNDDRVITANIGIEYENMLVIFSFAAHIEALCSSLSQQALRFPKSEEDIGKWCTDHHKILSKQTNKIIDTSFLKTDGLFKIDRNFVEPSLIHIDKKGIVSLKVHKDDKKYNDAVHSIHEGRLKVAPAYIINKSQCTVCGEDYKACNCLAFLEENCSVNVLENDLLGFIWTTRVA